MGEPAPRWDDIAETPWAFGELHKGNLQAALNGFALRFVLDYRRQLRSYADADICGFGVTLWLMGDRLGAANVWAKMSDEAYRGRIKYSSFGCYTAPLLLWFASVWLKDEDWHTEAEQTVEKLLKRRHLVMGDEFTSQLARLLRKEIDLPQIEVDDDQEDAIMATFYAGVRAYEEGNKAKTIRLWRKIPKLKEDGPLEYYLLLHERRKLR